MYKLTRPANDTAVSSSNYEALFSNMIWHVDIHFWGGSKEVPIFALIDDYSRKIKSCELIENQKAESVLEVLKFTIANYGKPYAILSDNGSETKGEFKRYLVENKRTFHYTVFLKNFISLQIIKIPLQQCEQLVTSTKMS